MLIWVLSSLNQLHMGPVAYELNLAGHYFLATSFSPSNMLL
jgi:hypothetical protein